MNAVFMLVIRFLWGMLCNILVFQEKVFNVWIMMKMRRGQGIKGKKEQMKLSESFHQLGKIFFSAGHESCAGILYFSSVNS